MSLVKSTIRTQVYQLLGNDSQIKGSGSDTSDLDTIIEAENEEILDSYEWSRRKADALINLVLPYSSGTNTTIGVTKDGTTVASDGSSDTVFTSAMVGRYIRIDGDDSYHKITTFTSATSIEIEKAWPKTTVSAGTFSVFQHVYTIGTDCDKIVSFSGNKKIVEIARQELDRLDPKRDTTGDNPEVFAYWERDSSDDLQVELWPVPNTVNVIRCHYLKRGTITQDTDKPLYPSTVLKWKAATTGCYFLKAKTGDQTWDALAKQFQSEYLRSYTEAREDDFANFGAVQAQKFRDDDYQRDDDYWRDHLI